MQVEVRRLGIRRRRRRSATRVGPAASVADAGTWASAGSVGRVEGHLPAQPVVGVAVHRCAMQAVLREHGLLNALRNHKTSKATVLRKHRAPREAVLREKKAHRATVLRNTGLQRVTVLRKHKAPRATVLREQMA